VARVRFDRAGDQIAGNDSFRLTVDDDDVEHLVARIHFHRTERDLTLERLECAEKKLLPGLAARVERAGDLHATERPVLQKAAILARQRHALSYRLIDDVDRQRGQPIAVPLPRAVIA